MEVYDDIDDMAECFVELYLNTCKDFVPNKKITINPKDKPWMNNMIKVKLKERDKWHKRWKKSKNDYYLQIFKQKRVEANIAMMQAKCNYFDKIKQKLCDPTIGSKQYWHLRSEERRVGKEWCARGGGGG